MLFRSLKDASALKEEAGSPSGLAYRLENEEPFLGAEYYLLASLRKRGYRDITLITDELGPEPAGFEVVELGWRMARGLYPSSVSADGSGARVRWVSLGGAEPASIRKTSAEGVPAGLPPSSWSIEEEADGFTLWLKEAGSYLLAWDGGHAAFQIPAPAVLRAQGELAQALAEVLVAGAGAKLLPGAAARPGALLLKEGGGRGAKATQIGRAHV